MSELKKYSDPQFTAKGEERAFVNLKSLQTLWFNTGTLCNLTCRNCYIESSPTNDQLSFITPNEIAPYLQEIKTLHLPTSLIGLTGGEPFLNPLIIPIIHLILTQGFDLLILTNANRVLFKHQESLLKLKNEFGSKLKIRVSLDHHTKEVHDKERGTGAFVKTMDQLKWLSDHHFELSIASRFLANESKAQSIEGHQQLLDKYEINIDLASKLVIFPEMNSKKNLPEITTKCWSILNIGPEDQMCSSERMIVKRKGDQQAVIMPCTLLAYDKQFILGTKLQDSKNKVFLNHPFCAEFCVLGGASCSSTVHS